MIRSSADLPDILDYKEEVLGDAKPILVALTAAVTLLLLIVCVNVGNLLLLRASFRAPEIVIRRALGASSRRARSTRSAAMLTVRMAGWALAVSISSCAIGS